jgi:hypothetical protein
LVIHLLRRFLGRFDRLIDSLRLADDPYDG